MLLDSKILLAISRDTSHRLGKILTDAENIKLIKMLRNIPPYLIGQLNEKNIYSFISACSSYIVGQFQGYQLPNLQKQQTVEMQDTETKELVYPTLPPNTTQSTNINSFYSITDLHYIQRFLTPRAQYKYTYVLLDTNNTDPNLTTDTKFGWQFANDANLQSGVVNNIGKIRDLVGMQIYPVKANFDAAPSHEYPAVSADIYTTEKYYNNFINRNNVFTILIEEFAAQAAIGRDGRKYHFILFPSVQNTEFVGWVKVLPPNPYIEYTTSGKGNGKFWFVTPITQFTTLTISMADPFVPITFSQTIRTLIPLQLIYLNESGESL